MKVLIAGAGGQIGRALLADVPDSVTAVGCSHAVLDVADAASVERCFAAHRPEIIVNAAAYTAVDRAETESELAKRVNTEGPRLLARAARSHGVRVIHISTDFVFDGAAHRPYAPDAPTAPLNVYGRTKRDGELAVLEEQPAAIVLRTAWVYAATGSNFLLTMLKAMRAHRSVRVVADQVGTPTSAASAAAALWRLALASDFRGIHHWTDAGVASWYDFAVAIAEEGAACGLLPPGVAVTPIATIDYPTAARRPPFSVLEKSSLASLALTPIHWRARLREVMRGMRNE